MKITTYMTHILLAFFLLISACSSSHKKDINAKMDSTLDPDKVLIVYLSRTNNTKAIAQIIHNYVDGTLVALELENPYPKDYQTTVDQVANENATGFLPPLKTKIDSMEKYDVVFVGFPTWGMQLPPPMKSFLKQYDLSGKTIVPFNTNAGYGVGSSFDTVKKLCPNSTILEGFSTKGGVERDGVYFVMEGEKEKQAQDEIKKWLPIIIKSLRRLTIALSSISWNLKAEDINEILNAKQQSIVTIAAFTANGDLTSLSTYSKLITTSSPTFRMVFSTCSTSLPKVL